MRIRTLISCVLAAAFAAAGPPVVAQPSARAQLTQAGERLQEINERYNEARLKRAALDDKLARARGVAARSEAALDEQRDRLGRAVRDLYMHRAANLGELFNAESFSELQRGRALAGRVVMSADTLILEVRKARAEQQAAQGELTRLRDVAKADERTIATERAAAEDAFERAQALVRQIGESTLEAERRAGIEKAGAIAAERITFAGPVRASAATAVRAAASQIGKPYRWGAEGPDAYDCSGLTMFAWAKAGVSLPHSSRAQYASLPKVPLSQLAPGDLVFSGRPIHHVAIYKGDGVVISAPHSGAYVREQSVWSLNPIGAARP